VNEDAGQERAWLRQDPTLEQERLRAPSLDLSARICVVASAQVVAQICAFVGVVAAFWHILWIAGVGILASGLVGVALGRLLASGTGPGADASGRTR
jgi:hypothetical protein